MFRSDIKSENLLTSRLSETLSHQKVFGDRREKPTKPQTRSQNSSFQVISCATKTQTQINYRSKEFCNLAESQGCEIPSNALTPSRRKTWSTPPGIQVKELIINRNPRFLAFPGPSQV